MNAGDAPHGDDAIALGCPGIAAVASLAGAKDSDRTQTDEWRFKDLVLDGAEAGEKPTQKDKQNSCGLHLSISLCGLQ